MNKNSPIVNNYPIIDLSNMNLFNRLVDLDEKDKYGVSFNDAINMAIRDIVLKKYYE